MPFEMLDIHAARQVNEVLKPYLHEYDLMKIANSLHVPVDSLPDVIWHTTASLGYEPTQESLAYGLGTVAHTVEVASRIQTFPNTDVSWMARIAPKDETGFQWEQGIMNLTLEHVKELDESNV